MPSAHEPSDEIRAQVFALSSFGVTQDDISRFLGISDDTLRKYYAAELARAAIDRNAEVAAFLFRSASGSTIPEGASYSDCIKAAMFWLKTRAQWRETNNLDHTSSDGSMTPKPGIDLSKAPAELLEWIVAQNDATDQK